MLRMPRWSLALAMIAAAWCAPVAQADVPSLAADATRPGVIDLVYSGPVGARVAFFERAGGDPQLLGAQTIGPSGRGRLHEATTWRCDRVVRHFTAVALAPDASISYGTFDVRTASCKHRFEVSAPRRVAVGAQPRIRVTDRWAIGDIKPRLCIDPPRAPRTCRVLAFRKAVTVVSRRFRATTPGRWRIELRVRSARIRTATAVGNRAGAGPPPPPTLLATGDSTMQGIDNFLADRLADQATVRSDVLPGTGISQTNRFWIRHAANQAIRMRPRTTVISVGANDAFDMTNPGGTTVRCCSDGWIFEYGRRVRAMMTAYIRGGRGRVLWLTLPLPRDPLRFVFSTAVNRAIRLAAIGLDRAHVIGFDQLFTPSGYSEVMRWRGQYVRVREPDGIHLNVEGTSIAAEVIERVLDGV
ncbi:MAG: GDSL-type esterase/lipase family protein [Solirubrobacteraceae bacterium]